MKRETRLIPRTPVYGWPSDVELELEEDTFRTPTTYWEFVHPELPILKVTSYNATKLPLALPGEEPSLTYYAVSFVISLQNCWAAFDDPNRWLIRFEEDLKETTRMGFSFTARRGAIDDEEMHQQFPNYWHGADYMQRRLIGPVVVQVYKSDVIQPGVYAMTPRVSRWEASGYVVPDDPPTDGQGDH